MKRSPASWTTAIAASALLAMPVGTWAQQTSPQQTSPTSSQTTASKPAGAQSSANEDLRKAEAALNDIPAASLTGAAKGRVAELKRHITALQRTASAGKSSSTPVGKTNPSTELAAADRILTELLGGEGTTGTAAPSAAGTSGKAASKAAPGVDDAAKAKLQEVRTHLTAFAASMGGGTPSPSPGTEDPSASASAAAATPSSTASSATPSTSTPQASPASPSSQPPTASSPSPATTPTPTEPAAAAAQQQPEQQPPSAASVDTDAVKRHLTAARESLSQLTQLPAAAQLTGDARTQVSQLISNFNELITTNTEWRASYAKVQANLNALVGDQRTDESPAAAPAPGAAGAVGTSGTTGVDPTIRAKLVEFRTHLMDFEKAAGGGATASAAPTASPAGSPAAAEAAAAAQPGAAAAAPSTPAAQPAEPTQSPTPATPSEPSPTGTSGTTSTPMPTGTTGTATPSTPPATATPGTGHQAMQSEAMNHIEAIEAVLNGSASSLDRAQVEQIRKELAALRKAINQNDKDK